MMHYFNKNFFFFLLNLIEAAVINNSIKFKLRPQRTAAVNPNTEKQFQFICNYLTVWEQEKPRKSRRGLLKKSAENFSREISKAHRLKNTPGEDHVLRRRRSKGTHRNFIPLFV